MPGPILAPDYEFGFICPTCGTHWPQLLFDAQHRAVRVYCERCGYFTDFTVNNGDN